MTAAVFNSWRRFRAQVLYVAPPLVIAYVTLTWATEKYVGSNSTPLLGSLGVETDHTVDPEMSTSIRRKGLRKWEWRNELDREEHLW